MMTVLFLALVVGLGLGNPSPVTWYQQQNLGDFHLDWVISQDCYRGTYGSLSLFTCPLQRVHLEPFAEVSSGTQLCVIQTRSHKEATRIVMDSDVKMLYNDLEEYIIVASNGPTKIVPEICSRSAFQGNAFNVMVVAEHPIRPSTMNPLAGRENVRLDAISDFLNAVNQSELEQLVNQLAYGPGSPSWITRNSYSPNATVAVNWIEEQFRAAGAITSQKPFTVTGANPMCNNVIADFPGTGTDANEIIFFGAHADSRNIQVNSQDTAAPGADDNGSGTALAIAFARTIKKQRDAGLLPPFKRTLRIGTFCGEEQGLYGSKDLANGYKADGTRIAGMYNVDMVGYRRTYNNGTLYPIVIAFMTGSVNLAFSNSCKTIMRNYLPTTTLGDTSGCCSDQQSFYAAGFASMGIFESDTSNVVYPDYHRATDTPDKLNYEQVRVFAQGIYSCALTSVL